jgi:hypothetical protein
MAKRHIYGGKETVRPWVERALQKDFPPIRIIAAEESSQRNNRGRDARNSKSNRCGNGKFTPINGTKRYDHGECIDSGGTAHGHRGPRWILG